MTIFKRTRHVCGVLAIGAITAGCGQSDETDLPPVTSDATEELVATVALSPTHRLDFFTYGADGPARIRETYHMDSDRDALTLTKAQVADRAFAEIYAILARDKVDPSVTTKLRAIDRRLAAEVASSPPTELRPAAIAPMHARYGEGIQQAQRPSSCNEPVWNWNGDVTWYRDNFCTGSPVFCQANSLAELSWGWDGPLRRFQATVFNQSHCAQQGWWQLLWRNNTGIHQPINTVIAPRLVETDVWSGGTNVRYLNSMTPREVGKRVGMTIYRTPQ